jgi:hypothetical protein
MEALVLRFGLILLMILKKILNKCIGGQNVKKRMEYGEIGLLIILKEKKEIL